MTGAGHCHESIFQHVVDLVPLMLVGIAILIAVEHCYRLQRKRLLQLRLGFVESCIEGCEEVRIFVELHLLTGLWAQRAVKMGAKVLGHRLQEREWL